MTNEIMIVYDFRVELFFDSFDRLLETSFHIRCAAAVCMMISSLYFQSFLTLISYMFFHEANNLANNCTCFACTFMGWSSSW